MKRIKSFKLFENEYLGDPDFDNLVEDIKIMFSDLNDYYDVDVVGTGRAPFDEDKDIIDINISRNTSKNKEYIKLNDASKNKGYIKLNDVKNKVNQLLDQIELDGPEYELRRVKIIYLDQIIRPNSITFDNENNLGIDELLDGDATSVEPTYPGDAKKISGSDILSGNIGINNISISLQSKDGE